MASLSRSLLIRSIEQKRFLVAKRGPKRGGKLAKILNFWPFSIVQCRKLWRRIRIPEGDIIIYSILEQRQYKNDSIQSKIILILNLPRCFPYRIGGEKTRQFQNRNYFWLKFFFERSTMRPAGAILKKKIKMNFF